jgi:hypothetical protein
MINGKLTKRILCYMALFVSTIAIAACSQGPVTNEEADEIRAELEAMRNQLAQVRSDMDSLVQTTDDGRVESDVEKMNDRLGTMMSRLSDVEEALKPEEPEPAPGGQPAGGTGGMAPSGGGAF